MYHKSKAITAILNTNIAKSLFAIFSFDFKAIADKTSSKITNQTFTLLINEVLTFLLPRFGHNLHIPDISIIQRGIHVVQIGNKGQVEFVVAIDYIARCHELAATNLVGFLQHALGAFIIVGLLFKTKEKETFRC